ncbi:MAG: helix-turn-helix domain-containing protein [Anaerolineae bacterium]|jgi:transcriptional regulator with XRE-family HTH domain|nr:helix-turn-helix domain-containing protein [Anaerolineae bacterium]MDH7474170.1 helix-turn-helix transcriptional regulator [Anaerolineae bacterium]
MMAKRKVEYEWDAERIKALRRYMGMTQQELSEELGTRQQTVSEWETGKYRPRGGMNRLLTLVAERVGFVYKTTPTESAASEESSREQEESPRKDTDWAAWQK